MMKSLTIRVNDLGKLKVGDLFTSKGITLGNIQRITNDSSGTTWVVIADPAERGGKPVKR